MNVWQELDAVLERYDAEFSASVCTGAFWSGALRLTLTNPPLAPSRSVTFYSVAQDSPDEVARAVLNDASAWMRETGVEPMPVPDWLRA